jgi:hypothetical protein
MADESQRAFFPGARWSDELKQQPLTEVLADYAALNARILPDLADIDDDELDASSVWWEEESMTVRVRLHRLDSHLRQHTVHAEKNLADLGIASTEAKRLSRQLYGALSEVEGALIGAVDVGEARYRALAEVIAARIREIQPSSSPSA